MRKRSNGFTLLEIMIAVAFIGIALISIMKVQGQGIRLTDQARLTSRNVFLARQIMAEAQNLKDLSEGLEQGNFEEPLDYLAWERRMTPVPFMTGLYKISVRIFPAGRSAKGGLLLEGFTYKEPQ
ncbi:MAG: prepilin-type N-terminal cleavage/methylation domain-containing protein [Deltaproteobacteria bacterium]|nr:prepilin-type N-terminal cleavage/methylation domain-containing protein [Deltaproteobacteria bacterium]